MQVTNCILSAICAGLFFRFLLRTFRSTYLSASLTILFAFSASWWKYSTDADSYVPSMLLLLLCLNLSIDGNKCRPYVLGIVHATSMFMHQLAVFFYPVVLVGLLFQSRRLSRKKRAILVLRYSATAFMFTLAVNYYCFHLQTGAFGINAFARWLTSYLHGPNPYAFSFDLWSNLLYTIRGNARLFFGGRLNWLKGLASPSIVALACILATSILVLAVQLIRDLKRTVTLRCIEDASDSAFNKQWALCSLWVGVYLSFLFFWYPYFTPYRMFYLPAVLILLGITLSRYESMRPPGRQWYTALFAVTLALSNFLFFIYPLTHVEKNPPLVLALEMNRRWAPGTSIYYCSSSADNELFRYFNPATRWLKAESIEKALTEKDLQETYDQRSSAWLETSELEHLTSSTEGSAWLTLHVRDKCGFELTSDSYNIKYVQIFPAIQDGEGRSSECN